MAFTNVMFFSGSILHQAFAPTDTRENILAKYSYRDYLRCLTHRLGPFLSDNDFVYLLNKANPVFADGKITMVLHEPSDHVFGKDSTKLDAKLGEGTTVGSFTRTASIFSDPASFGLGAQARFARDNATQEYAVVTGATAPTVAPEGKTWVSSSMGNASSRIMKADADAFVAQMREAIPESPVFSVCDCNSFHTSGYLWGLYAIRSVMKEGSDAAVAILNFDQHPDVGKDDPLGSDKWGWPLLSNVRNGCYLSVGNSADGGPGLNAEYKWTSSVVIRKGGASTALNTTKAKEAVSARDDYENMSAEQKLNYVAGVLTSQLSSKWRTIPHGALDDAEVSELKYAQAKTSLVRIKDAKNFPLDLYELDLNSLFALFWKNLKDHLGRPIEYVFITVDRDVIQGHHTQWGERCFLPNGHTLIRTMTSVYEALARTNPDCKIIGVDITGLPESREVYQAQTNKIRPPDEAWKVARDQIEKLYKWANHYLARQWWNPTARLVDSMGLIFDNLTRDLRGKTLTPYVAPEVQSNIRAFWMQYKPKYDLLRAGQSVVLSTSLRPGIHEKLDSFVEALRAASRTKAFIPKQTKLTLSAYASRISSVIQHDKEVMSRFG